MQIKRAVQRGGVGSLSEIQQWPQDVSAIHERDIFLIKIQLSDEYTGTVVAAASVQLRRDAGMDAVAPLMLRI